MYIFVNGMKHYLRQFVTHNDKGRREGQKAILPKHPLSVAKYIYTKEHIMEWSLTHIENVPTHSLMPVIYENIKEHIVEWSLTHVQNVPKTFSHSGKLNIHQRTHIGVKHYSCRECTKTYSCSNHLQTHQITHTVVKP